ncbi:hypothetical protein [Novosphingobium aquimarinum]|uniref:hypothetical protein n=1 Tax=Novosphingobium aquimarinum TaxID=2682494 RepID=UPI0012EB4E3E|nr:hypothetical protein [Novosphingobium aquimarinum]
MWRRSTGLFVCGIGLVTSVPAHAKFSPKTELVRCGKDDCLRVSGHREEASHVISLNGVPVAAEGKNDWRVDLPIDAVRKMCGPRAQAIEVTLRDPQTRRESLARARLPIGLLGDSSKLAAIEITAF